MKMLFGLAIGLFLTGAAVTVVRAQNKESQEKEPVVLAQGKAQSFDSMVEDLSKADVVFVGENHDHKQGHALELALLQGLQAKNSSLALALEMFERDVQGVLDEYLAGYITESSFLQASRPWPNYKTDYAPLVEFCKAHHLPVIASNAPRRYVNLVSRKGQEALHELPKTSKAYLAPLPYNMEIPAEYDRQLTDIFGGAHGQPSSAGPSAAQPAMPSSANMKQAQGLWDATMADSVARFLRSRSRHKLTLHINGAMHSDSGFGIVDRLRHAHPNLKIKLVTIRPSARYPDPPTDLPANAADYVLLTPTEEKPKTP
jgi:uncharacterized iron-regulated protein